MATEAAPFSLAPLGQPGADCGTLLHTAQFLFTALGAAPGLEGGRRSPQRKEGGASRTYTEAMELRGSHRPRGEEGVQRGSVGYGFRRRG